MSGYSRRLDNPVNWSFKAGRLFDIDIRVHLVFVLCAVWILSKEMVRARDLALPFSAVLWDTLGTFGILFFIVLIHEFGHCWGARHTGGSAEEILMWPLGGLAMVSPPNRARAHLITAAAGPMVNVIFCAVSSVALVAWLGRPGGVPWNPLDPFWPVDATVSPTGGQMWLMRFFGLNYVLLLFNLLPVFPLDGGRILQAYLWPQKGYERSMEIATGVGMIGAIGLGLFGLFTGEQLLLIAIAAFGYLSCWQTRRLLREGALVEDSGGEFGYDFSRGYSSLDRSFSEPERGPGYLARRRAKREAARKEAERQKQREHEAEIERILKKVSDHGLRSLTARERRLLEKETERKRAGM
jgi:stage IV sporulation protein FB